MVKAGYTVGLHVSKWYPIQHWNEYDDNISVLIHKLEQAHPKFKDALELRITVKINLKEPRARLVSQRE